MTSNLKTLHDRIKRGLSEDVSVAPSFEAARNVKSPMKSINNAKRRFLQMQQKIPQGFLQSFKVLDILNSQAFRSSCGARISQLCKLSCYYAK